jgi:hypothetical protein
MLANDMKRGQTGTLKNGWKFEIYDNKRGIIRMAKVFGFATEIGSIYIDDIKTLGQYPNEFPIEFSPRQRKQIKTKNQAMDAFLL